MDLLRGRVNSERPPDATKHTSPRGAPSVRPSRKTSIPPPLRALSGHFRAHTHQGRTARLLNAAFMGPWTCLGAVSTPTTLPTRPSTPLQGGRRRFARDAKPVSPPPLRALPGHFRAMDLFRGRVNSAYPFDPTKPNQIALIKPRATS